ncbi:MAG: GDSL-type esterase/lipase family protein [bacterium]
MGRLFTSLVAVSALLMICGCDGGDGIPPIPPHDFGLNNPDLYLVMGDSISSPDDPTWPSRLAGMISNNTIVNEAVPGQWAKKGADRVDGLLNWYRPGYLLVLYGANDVIMGQPPAVVVEHLREIVQAAKTNQTIPVIATMTPMIEGLSIFQGGIDAVNAGIVQMGIEEDIPVARLDLAFGDGAGLLTLDYLHPNDAGQQLIAETFYGALHPVPAAVTVKDDSISSSRSRYH